MSWSNKPLANDPRVFPMPPMWVVWTAYHERQVDADPNKAGLGKVRHKTDFKKARQYVGYHADQDGKWWNDWAIYEWTPEGWALRFEGKKGEPKKDHPLFTRKKSKKITVEEPVIEEAERLAYESIVRDLIEA